MISYFKDTMMVNHPITFLCGPYYSKNDKSDRRNILLNFFDDKFNRRVISLIIDDFIIAENIKDDTINIQLLEEIFASISSKTYIFLDTMSAASELGLFANHSNSNKIHVMLPCVTDILENKIGFFVSDIILGQNGKRINLDYYRPKIIKKAIATNYVAEHYGFINEELPNEIADKILRDTELNGVLKNINVSDRCEIPQDFAEFNILVQNDYMDVGISIKTLFYIIVNLVYKKFDKSELKDKQMNKVTIDFVDDLYDNLRKTVALSISIIRFQKLYDYENVNILTNLHTDIKTLIKHILKFIVLYHESDPRNGKMFISGLDKIITIKDTNLKQSPYELFNLDSDKVQLLYNIKDNGDDFFEEFEIKRNRKTRTLCRYKKDANGNKARELHNNLLNIIKSIVSLSNNSYAYQDGKSIVSCANEHKNSRHFIKLDIKNFFNSIDINLLTDDLIEVLDIDCVFKEHVKTIVKSCTYKNILPLGFTISPILTEIYMKKFDINVLELMNKYGITYTRYADDIMLSSIKTIDEEMKNSILAEIEKLLSERKLKINMSKCSFISLSEVGQHVKYIGLNIVKGTNGNFLSVGKKYKNIVAKQYLRYLELPEETEEQKKTRFYESRVIAGKISFIQQVEGHEGFISIIERIKASTHGRLNITTDKIIFEKHQ